MSTQYDFLLATLGSAIDSLETAKSVSRELFRDGMLTGECREIGEKINDIRYMKYLVEERAKAIK
jgi:hypothetical protein